MVEYDNDLTEEQEKGWSERKRDALELLGKFGSSILKFVSNLDVIAQDILYPMEKRLTARFANLGNKTPVAIFWDYENFALPKNKLSSEVFLNMIQPGKRNYEIIAKRVFGKDYHVQHHLQILRDAGFEIIRTQSIAKQATDEKLKNNCKRFCSYHPTGIVVILISGDGGYIDLVKELVSKGHEVRLIHSNKKGISREMQKLVPRILDINTLIEKREKQLISILCKEEDESLWLEAWEEMKNYVKVTSQQEELLKYIAQKSKFTTIRSRAQQHLIKLVESQK